MKRRTIIAALGGTTTTWPLAISAQQPRKLPTIGFLGANTAAAQGRWTAAFVKRLGELGWIEGRTVAIEYRWAEGRAEGAPELVAEFVGLKVDVIVTSGPNTYAAKQATSVIPIVFAITADPIATGLVASLSRPGGNLTGLSFQIVDAASKRLQLLQEIVPHTRRVAILGNPTPVFKLEVAEIEKAARTLGLEVIVQEIRQREEIAPAIEALKGRADALYVQSAPFFNVNNALINKSALSARLPTIHGTREQLGREGLMSCGPDVTDLFRRSADFVDKILRGAKPADLPVEQPTKWEFVINLTTAKALGLAISPNVLASADKVIE